MVSAVAFTAVRLTEVIADMTHAFVSRSREESLRVGACGKIGSQRTPRNGSSPLAAMFHLLVAGCFLLTGITASADHGDWTVRRLVRGAAIQSTNGIDVGPDGNLWVATVFGREIAVVDRYTGAVLERLGPDLGIETPDDLVFGPDGLLYWTEPFTGKVGRRGSDGTISTVAQLPLGANPLAFNDEGRLFVAAVVFNDILFEIDPQGIEPPRTILDGLGNLNGFAFGPDGLLYSPQAATNSVVRIDVDAGTVETFATGFGFAASVDFDSRGRLHVNDAGAGEIVRIDLATGERELLTTLPTGVDNITFDSRDNLYATQLLDGSITRVRPNGRKRIIQRGGMSIPGGLVAVPAASHGPDELWVADFFSLRVFNSRTGRQTREIRAVPFVSAMTLPNTVALDGDQLVLSSWLGNAVQVVDRASGEVLANRFDFTVPINAILFQGDLVVSELFTGAVVRSPIAPATPGERSILASDLLVPAGLAASGDDLWATDTFAGTLVQVIDGSREVIPPRLVASGLAQPEGLAVLPDGDLVVVEAGAGRVSRVDPVSGAVETIAEGLELGTGAPPLVAPPTWHFNGVAVGSNGALYVTGDTANVIYKLRPPRPRMRRHLTSSPDR